MPWQKGQSGNPKGRAPKQRVLTSVLEAAGGRRIETADGPLTGKRLLAAHVWNIVTTGQTELPDGRVLAADFSNWAETVRWLYSHIDGPPKAETAVEHSGGLHVHVTYDDVDDLPAPAASGPADDDA